MANIARPVPKDSIGKLTPGCSTLTAARCRVGHPSVANVGIFAQRAKTVASSRAAALPSGAVHPGSDEDPGAAAEREREREDLCREPEAAEAGARLPEGAAGPGHGPGPEGRRRDTGQRTGEAEAS